MDKPKYNVEILFSAPYPVTKRYETEGSNFSAAIGKALRLWRKDVKGKRVKELTIRALRGTVLQEA